MKPRAQTPKGHFNAFSFFCFGYIFKSALKLCRFYADLCRMGMAGSCRARVVVIVDALAVLAEGKNFLRKLGNFINSALEVIEKPLPAGSYTEQHAAEPLKQSCSPTEVTAKPCRADILTPLRVIEVSVGSALSALNEAEYSLAHILASCIEVIAHVKFADVYRAVTLYVQVIELPEEVIKRRRKSVRKPKKSVKK